MDTCTLQPLMFVQVSVTAWMRYHGLGGGGGLVPGIANVCLNPSQPTISTVASCKHRSQPGVSVKCHKWGNNFTKLCSWTCGHSSWTTLAKKCPLRIHTSLVPHIGCFYCCPTATRTNIKLCWSWTNAKGLCQRLNFSRVSECVPTINRREAVEKWIVMTNVKASRTTALAGTARSGLGLDGRQSVRRTAAAALQGRAVTWWDVSRVVFYPATFLTQLNFLACLWLDGGTSFSPHASNRIEMWGCCTAQRTRDTDGASVEEWWVSGTVSSFIGVTQKPLRLALLMTSRKCFTINLHYFVSYDDDCDYDAGGGGCCCCCKRWCTKRTVHWQQGTAIAEIATVLNAAAVFRLKAHRRVIISLFDFCRSWKHFISGHTQPLWWR